MLTEIHHVRLRSKMARHGTKQDPKLFSQVQSAHGMSSATPLSLACCIRQAHCKARTPSMLPGVRGHQLRHEKARNGTYDEEKPHGRCKNTHSISSAMPLAGACLQWLAGACLQGINREKHSTSSTLSLLTGVRTHELLQGNAQTRRKERPMTSRGLVTDDIRAHSTVSCNDAGCSEPTAGMQREQALARKGMFGTRRLHNCSIYKARHLPAAARRAGCIPQERHAS
jgi:hypothetical protein